MIDLLTSAGCPMNYAFSICNKTIESYAVCKRSGKPASSRKRSLTHIDEAINQEVQADFTFAEIRSIKYCVLHVVETETGYLETSIVKQRSGEIMTLMLETL